MYRLARLEKGGDVFAVLCFAHSPVVRMGQFRQAKRSGAPGCRLRRANKGGDSFSSVESNSLGLVMKSSPNFCPLCPLGLMYIPSSGSPIGSLHKTQQLGFSGLRVGRECQADLCTLALLHSRSMWTSMFPHKSPRACQPRPTLCTTHTLRNIPAISYLLKRRVCTQEVCLKNILGVARIRDHI